MKTLKIEGFTVETDLDEQRTFCRCLAIDNIDESDEKAILEKLHEELTCGHNLVDFIEQVGINQVPVANYFYTNSRGYKNRALEPYNWRANKKSITLIYTGAMGGGEWYAKVIL